MAFRNRSERIRPNPTLMNRVFAPNQICSPHFLSWSQNDLLSVMFSQRATRCNWIRKENNPAPPQTAFVDTVLAS